MDILHLLLAGHQLGILTAFEPDALDAELADVFEVLVLADGPRTAAVDRIRIGAVDLLLAPEFRRDVVLLGGVLDGVDVMDFDPVATAEPAGDFCTDEIAGNRQNKPADSDSGNPRRQGRQLGLVVSEQHDRADEHPTDE
ncbi:hypothetical protein C443_14712 [Haloarcula argentinensis DSM 12282]|uniref:Uncharacterized protein n=1 Tax=Haloarcula argentinensis TaxID=43776 RepID=A0ABU2F258_HALAR|nr:hypothetical protein C443_14712 [Haloarcula argentinensis DSM 12282]MDS0254623.1 hypothetical protein [Haloarcula argentinensis]